MRNPLAHVSRRTVIVLAVAAVLVGGYELLIWATHKDFPSDQTPRGAYARIVLAITEGRPREAFAYLETQAQWASYSIRDFRAKAYARVETSYPEPERTRLLDEYRAQAKAPDGADIWATLAERNGWIAQLRRDLSGVKSVEVAGPRATLETARGTRYTFRRRENGIWGLTTFTGDLVAEAEKAARDLEVIDRAHETGDR